MTANRFNRIDEMEQIEAIWEKSTRLTEREDDTFLYILHQIDSFYVEEKVHKKYNVRHALVAFPAEANEMMQPYLDKINISSLKD